MQLHLLVKPETHRAIYWTTTDESHLVTTQCVQRNKNTVNKLGHAY